MDRRDDTIGTANPIANYRNVDTCSIWVIGYFMVDQTALRPIIVQSIHFFDTDTGENFNSRTSWGPVKFGFCGFTIERLESIGNSIKKLQ